MAARARVGGGDEQEARREDRGALASHDRHPAVLQRLAQRLERRPRELGQLVEEEHAVMGEARLPRQRQRAATHQPRRRDHVMRRAERALGDQPAPAMLPGDAVDARHLDRLGPRQRRQDRGQAPREHRLAHAGWAREQEVVGAGRRDGQGLDDVGVAADVGEVEVAGGRRDDALAGIGRRRALAAAQDLGHLGQAGGADDVEPLDEARLQHPLARDHEPRQARVRRSLGDGEGAAAGADLASQAQLAEDGVALERVGGQVAADGEDRARDGEVEARAGLAHRRGREVHRDALERELEARVEDRRPHALARLAHRPVAEAHDREVGQARADVDLDGDPPRLEAVDRERGDAGEHGRHARPRPATVEDVVCDDIAQDDARSAGTPQLPR